MKIIADLQAHAPEIAQLRRTIHSHPELAFEEFATSDLIAQKLEEWGIPFHRGLGRTGVVGIIKAGSSPRAIGLRADMDALAITEDNHFEHASAHHGRMHACGHDGHTSMLLGAAQYLAKHRNFDGTAYLIFQPAEEGAGGAREMLADGLFERFPMQAVFGMHNLPGLPVGQFAISPGAVMASSAEFKISVAGKGTHAAMPNLGIDPLPVACEIVGALQTIANRRKNPLDPAVVSVTMIHGGHATNVVADTCEIQGTVRTFATTTSDMLEKAMRTCAEHVALAHGATVDFQFSKNYIPTVNAATEAAFVRGVLQTIVGADDVRPQEPLMASEDFGFMLSERPGAYCFIGNGDGEHRAVGHGQGPCTVHNPNYDFNDALIPLGATFWVRLVADWLAPSKGEGVL
jgi:amidohydrolase